MTDTFEDLPLQRSCGAAAMYYRQLEIDPDFQENQRSLYGRRQVRAGVIKSISYMLVSAH